MKTECNSGETGEHYELALFTTSKRFQPIRMQCLLPVKIDAIINKDPQIKGSVLVLCINCWCDSLVQLLYKTAWAKHVSASGCVKP